MVHVRSEISLVLGVLLVCCSPRTQSQESDADPLNTSGQVVVNGRPTQYLIRRLPVNAFPQLPLAVQDALTRRGCLIPQTYEARWPENVVHASFERPGSSDWAVLCSAKGAVSLLVFLGSGSGEPAVLATAPETERLQSHGVGPVLGFNWAIDPASPQQVHEGQIGMRHPQARLDHDALADSVVDQRTVYHFYSNHAWTLLNTQD
ncbi:MAG: hypothetical protein ABSF23_15595 [Terracidiphilus sp.]|jgi:hypothetical protein